MQSSSCSMSVVVRIAIAKHRRCAQRAIWTYVVLLTYRTAAKYSMPDLLVRNESSVFSATLYFKPPSELYIVTLTETYRPYVTVLVSNCAA